MIGDERPERWSTAERDEAMALAAEHGAAEASRRTGIPDATIRAWTYRLRHAFEGDAAGALIDIGDDDQADELEPVGEAADAGPADLLAASERWYRRAERAAERMDHAAAAGRAQDARNLATVAGIATDKALMLARAAKAAEGERAVLTERQGEQIASVIRGVIADLNLPADLKRAVPPLVRRHLEALGGDLPVGYTPLDAEITAILGMVRAAAVDEATKVAVDERTRRIAELRDEIVARRELDATARAAVDELVERTEADRPAVDVDAVDVSRPSSFDELDDDDVDRGDDLSVPPGADEAAAGGDAPSAEQIGREAGRERSAASVSRRRRSPADQLLHAAPDSRRFRPEPERPAGWETRLPRDGLAPERPGGDAA